MANLLGLQAKTYYGTAGSTPTIDPSNELTNIRDLTLNLETGEADTTTRGADGWRSTLATLKDGTVEFEMVWDTNDAGFTAILNAWLNSTLIAALVLDTDVTGGQGLDADFAVTNLSRSEPLEEAITSSVSLKPNAGLRAPAWYTVP